MPLRHMNLERQLMDTMITSASNPRIKRLVELRKKAKLRRESGLFLIEGTRLCMDTPGQSVEEAYVTQRWLAEAPEKDRERLRQFPVTVVTEEVLAKAADTASPQGILCVAKTPSYTWKDLLKPCRAPLLLILEDIQDPGNLGTMFRTAEAAGATGIVMSRGTVDLFNPKVVRATMSAVFRLPFLFSADLCADIRFLQAQGIGVYAAHLGGSRPYDALPLLQGSAFLIGNEGNGLSDRSAEAADEKIIIPMAGAAESLNAAMAAGILLFEAARQRRT